MVKLSQPGHGLRTNLSKRFATIQLPHIDKFGNSFFQSVLRSMLVYATLNDDPESLETIVTSDFAFKTKQALSRTLHRSFSIPETEPVLEVTGRSLERHKNPLLVACTQGYSQCVRILYKYGYDINVYKEDSKYIEQLMQMDHASASASTYYLYEKMWFGEKSYQNLKSIARKKVVSNDEYDAVERYIRFRAYASPTYISVAFSESRQEDLATMDPMRKAIACSTYATYLGEYYMQQQAEYQAVGRVCEQYAEDILDQCQNMEEVKVLLNNNSCGGSQHCKNQNWCIALWEKNKALVGHHYFQKFLWDKMTGGDLDWNKYFFRWKIIILFFSLFCFVFSPIVIMMDFCRKADILFVPPVDRWKKKDKRRRKASDMVPIVMNVASLASPPAHKDTSTAVIQETFVFRFFREQFHRPLFRISTFVVFEVFFLVCLTLSLVDPKDTAISKDWWWYDVITGAFSLLYLFENLMDIWRMKLKYFSSPWNLSSLCAHFLIVFGHVLLHIGFMTEVTDERHKWSGNHLANVGATLMSLGATLAIIRTLRWLRLIKSIGPMVICINKVINDILVVLILFAVILLACSLGLMSMFKPFRDFKDLYPGGVDDNPGVSYRFDTNDNIFSTMFWRFLDPGQPTAAFILRNKTDDEREATLQRLFRTSNMSSLSQQQQDILSNATTTKSLEFSHIMGITMWAAYQFFVVIITVNILIALMNTTYSKLIKEADTEWKYHTAVVYNSFLTPQSVLPPPLRPIYYLARLIYRTRCQGTSSKCDQDSEAYWTLMTKLIKRKTQSDIEKSQNDNFSDMRKDVRNTIHNEVVKKLEEHDKTQAIILDQLRLSEQNNEKLLEKVNQLTYSVSTQNKILNQLKASEERSQQLVTKVEELLELIKNKPVM